MITSRPPTKSAKALTRAVSRSVVRSDAPTPPVTYPAALFAAGEPGIWLDFGDLTTMFQDAAGTIPAIENNQVALIRDKSGRGNHVTQSGSNRPILRRTGAVWYLEFDGTDDYLQTASLDFTGTNKVTLFAAYMKAVDTGLAVLVEHGPSVTSNAGSFNLTAPNSAAANYGFNLNGNGTVATRVASPFAALSATNVLTCVYDLAGAGAAAEMAIRVNGVTPSLTAVGDAGTGNFGNYPLYIGCRGAVSNPAKGYMVGLIVRGALTDSTGITGTEQQLAGRSGISFP